jgi:hypothetical protein
MGVVELHQHLTSSCCLGLEYGFGMDLWGCLCLKPSEKTPLCGIACQNIIAEVIKENNLPEGIV